MTIQSHCVDTFIHLFRGRADAYGAWRGGSVRAPLTPAHFERHLTSADPDDWIGVYNVIGNRCSWGCVDIDTDDYGLAQNVRCSLHYKGIPAWIEQTTRGYHVWVFPAEFLVSAKTMRKALTAACQAIDFAPKEVFPKQNQVRSPGLGNYVRLPFNGWRAKGTHIPRMFVEYMDTMAVLGDFLDDMHRLRAPTSLLESLADMLPDPQRVDISVDFQAGLEIEDDIARVGGLAYRIWRDGPLMGNDRSTTLVFLARCMAERDVPPDTAAKVLASADMRWGKQFLDRGESGVAIMQRIVDKAYGERA